MGGLFSSRSIIETAPSTPAGLEPLRTYDGCGFCRCCCVVTLSLATLGRRDSRAPPPRLGRAAVATAVDSMRGGSWGFV